MKLKSSKHPVFRILAVTILPILAAGVFLCGSVAQAMPLHLNLLDFPDIVSAFIDVTYDASSDAFSANGFALELDNDGVAPNETIIGGTFALGATIDDLGDLGPGGTLTIGGTIPTLGFNSGTLLTGDLTAFGFPVGGGNPLEFVFDVTGGDAAGLWGGFAGGVILGASGFTGDWTADWDNLIGGLQGTGSAVADTGAIPEPATLTLMLMGGGALLGVRKRFQRKRS
jgi:hypothetical protein